MNCIIITFVLIAIFKFCQGDSYFYYDDSLLASNDNLELKSMQFHPRDELSIRERRDLIKNEDKIEGTILSASTTPEPKIDSENIENFTENTNHHNLTKIINDTTKYYKISFSADESKAQKFWVDMANHPNASVNKILSHSHRRAVTVKLSFDFPYYGQSIRIVTVTTGGFLYTGELVHRWLAATQYVAPLMANFDTKLSNNSKITYADNGTAFIVEWKQVMLKEQPDVGKFTFQVTLLKNGDIIFVYAAVPSPVKKIQNDLHSVQVGISDAYFIDKTIFFFKKRTMYEYDRVNLTNQDIRDWTIIKFHALPTCVGLSNCNDCLSQQIGFDCQWCQNFNRCSSGIDRHKEAWISNDCELTSLTRNEICPIVIANSSTYDVHNNQDIREREVNVA